MNYKLFILFIFQLNELDLDLCSETINVSYHENIVNYVYSLYRL